MLYNQYKKQQTLYKIKFLKNQNYSIFYKMALRIKIMLNLYLMIV